MDGWLLLLLLLLDGLLLVVAAVVQVQWWQTMVRTKGGQARRGLDNGARDLGGLWWGRYEKRRGRVFRYGVVPLWSSVFGVVVAKGVR